jgi:hypothetical protein
VVLKKYNFKFSILWTNVCPQTVLPLRCSLFPSVRYFHYVLHPQSINSFNLNLPPSLSYCKTVVPTFRRNLHPPISTQESSILLRHVITYLFDHTASQYPHLPPSDVRISLIYTSIIPSSQKLVYFSEVISPKISRHMLFPQRVTWPTQWKTLISLHPWKCSSGNILTDC